MGVAEVEYYLRRGQVLRAQETGRLAHGAWAGLTRFAAWAVAGLRGEAWLSRSTYAELAALDDRTLRDIGLTRGELRYIARETAAGRPGIWRPEPSDIPASASANDLRRAA